MMPRTVQLLPNNQAYDLWAPFYDSDGNILQSLDSFSLSDLLLPRLFDTLAPKSQSVANASGLDPEDEPIRITDLGCGTGRATLALISALKDPSNSYDISRIFFHRGNGKSRAIHITGLDSSEGMLGVAQARVPALFTIEVDHTSSTASDSEQQASRLTVQTRFQLYDILAASGTDSLSTPSPQPADAIVCALVIEHLASLSAFFSHLVSSRLLKPGGCLLLTNMHPDMAGGATPSSSLQSSTNFTSAKNSGAKSDDATDRESPGTSAVGPSHNPTGAGFNDVATGNKIRAENSFAHTIPDVLRAADTARFRIVDGTESQAPATVPARGPNNTGTATKKDGYRGVEELRVERWMIDEGIVDVKRGEKWAIGGVRCWFGMLLRWNE